MGSVCFNYLWAASSTSDTCLPLLLLLAGVVLSNTAYAAENGQFVVRANDINGWTFTNRDVVPRTITCFANGLWNHDPNGWQSYTANGCGKPGGPKYRAPV